MKDTKEVGIISVEDFFRLFKEGKIGGINAIQKFILENHNLNYLKDGK